MIDYFGRIAGIIGLYCYEKDKGEAFWLGWFGVMPDCRRRGIGERLLRFAISKAKKSDKKFLRENLAEGLKESLKLNKINSTLLGLREIKIF